MDLQKNKYENNLIMKYLNIFNDVSSYDEYINTGRGEVVPNISLLKNNQKLQCRKKVERIVTFEVTESVSTVLLNNCTNVRDIKVNGVLTEPNEDNQIIVTESGTYEIELDFIGKEIDSDIFISSFTETSSIISFSNDFFYAMKNIPMTGAINMTAINIPYSVEQIDNYAFYKNKKNNKY